MGTAEPKTKKLRYVKVYDELFHNIKEGIYTTGSQLPSEPELAKMMNVSRMTLRQALSLLQEDGVIKNIRGRGNFVIKNTSKWKNGIETVSHPIDSCINEEIEEVELEFRIEPPTEYISEVLEKQTAVVLIVDRWYKAKGEIVSYSLTFIPIETISEFGVNLNIKEEILKFLEKDIYEKSHHSKLKIKYSGLGNITSGKYLLSNDNKFFLIEESLYYKNQYPCIVNKHYLPIDITNIELSASNDKK